MKAILFREHGGTHKLSYEDLPTPTIGPEEVLVRVKACALNHLDIWIREGNQPIPCRCRMYWGRTWPGLWSKSVLTSKGSLSGSEYFFHQGSAAGAAMPVSPGETTSAAPTACSGR